MAAAVGLIAYVCTVGGVLAVRLVWPTAANDRPSHATYRLHSGVEEIAYFMSSSTCIGNNYPGFPDAVKLMQTSLANGASSRGYYYASAGISVDWSPKRGFEYLSGLTAFDEVVVGRNWLNIGATRLVSDTFAGSPTIPQVIVVRRRVDVTGAGVRYADEKVVARKVGAEEIVSWVAAGTPLR